MEMKRGAEKEKWVKGKKRNKRTDGERKIDKCGDKRTGSKEETKTRFRRGG